MGSFNQLVIEKLSTVFVFPAYKTRYLYSQLEVTSLASFIMAGVVFISLWSVVDHVLLSVWFLLISSTCVARIALYFFYQSRQPEDHELTPWNTWYVFSLYLASISWGMIGFFFDPAWAMTQQVVLLAVVAVLAVGAMLSYAVISNLYNFFLFCLIFPLASSFLFSDELVYRQNSAALIAYGLALFIIARQFSRSLEYYADPKGEHVAALENSRNELLLWKENKEQEDDVARALYTRISRIKPLEKTGLKSFVLPMGHFSGDFMFSATTTEGEEYILMADFSGHGLPAALGAIPISSIFYGMAAKNHIPAAIVNELNRKLYQLLPTNHFCCAGFIVLNSDHTKMEIWNAGLPPVLVFNEENEVIRRCHSNHVPMGIEKQDKDYLQFETVDLKKGERVLVYSDGVIEAGNRVNDLFGIERLEAVLKSTDKNTGYIDVIQSALGQHISTNAQEDDISILEIKGGI